MSRGKKKHREPAPAPKRVEPAPAPERAAISPRALVAGALALVALGLVLFLTVGSGDGGDEEEAASAGGELRTPWVDPDGQSPIVGSVDVNPGDGSLWLSTNTGLFRVPKGSGTPERVTGRLETDVGEGSISEQLVIRFRGPDDLIASGHPPAGEALPAALGMIASKDAGKTWTGLGEVGRNDFHAIQIAGDLIVAGVYGEPSVTVSRDGGRTFETSTPPETLVDLEVDPDDPKRWVASTFEELVVTEDEGRSWRPVEPIPNVRFAWPAGDTLLRVDPGGPVKVSSDGGRTWQDRGSTGGEPQAMFAETREHVYVALFDGTVKESTDGGRTWTDRVVPPA
jgi:hypothetical protein